MIPSSYAFITLAIAILVLPHPNCSIIPHKRAVASQYVTPPAKFSLSEIIISITFLCTTIAAALQTGLAPLTAYEISFTIIDNPELKFFLQTLLLPNNPELRLSTSHYNHSYSFQPGSQKNAHNGNKENSIFNNLSSENIKLLRTMSAQLHNLYELTIMRGTALQGSLIATVTRLEEELLAQSIERAEQAAVQLGGPLAAGFLPAFIIIGLIPTIIGMAKIFFTDIGV